MNAAQERLLDREKLDENTMSNAELQRELFVLFFDQVPVYIDQLDEAAQSGDTDAWKQAAHGVKGSARALGFVRVAALSREAELLGPDAAIVETLREAVEATRSVVGEPVAA